MQKNKLKDLLISKDTTIKQAMKKLNETAQQILFVVDGCDKLIATVTDGDIRRGIINGTEFGNKIEQVMHRSFAFLPFDTPDVLEKAKELVVRNKIKVPILDKHGVIVNVITSVNEILEETLDGKPRKFHPNKVIIMAGGKGSRLDPFTRILPKPLIPIGDKAVIELIMEKFFKNGFGNFIYTLNYKKEYMKLFLKENCFAHEYVIDWVEESGYSGTAGSLCQLKNKVKETFFVTNCDSLLSIDFEKVLKWHKDHNASITIIGSHNEIKIPFGVLIMSEGKLTRMSEKPIHDVIINTGVYVIEPHVIDYIPKEKHLDMNHLIEEVSKKEKVTVFPTYGSWLDIGQWKEYNKSINEIIKK